MDGLFSLAFKFMIILRPGLIIIQLELSSPENGTAGCIFGFDQNGKRDTKLPILGGPPQPHI